MRYALSLGEKGRLMAPPNPWVGCVIVKNQEIVGEGHTQSFGGAHAEAVALEQAKGYAKGATAYVTLEPCAHHGQTPPCTEALIKAGIKQVVIPFKDPDPRVSGKGIAALQAAGIDIIIGIAKDEAERSLRPYLFQRQTGRPYTILKLASSLDGRTAAQDGSSKWITGECARRDVHLLRATCQGIVVGSNTARLDKPRLTVRNIDQPHNQPKRILIDICGKSPKEGADYDLIFTTNRHHPYKKAYILPKESFIEEALTLLGKERIVSLLIEGGAATHVAFLPYAQQLTIYYGNCLLGSEGLASFPNLSIKTIKVAPRFTLEGVYRFDQDVRFDYKIS